jgi:hypothetical protein
MEYYNKKSRFGRRHASIFAIVRIIMRIAVGCYPGVWHKIVAVVNPMAMAKNVIVKNRPIQVDSLSPAFEFSVFREDVEISGTNIPECRSLLLNRRLPITVLRRKAEHRWERDRKRSHGYVICDVVSRGLANVLGRLPALDSPSRLIRRWAGGCSLSSTTGITT